MRNRLIRLAVAAAVVLGTGLFAGSAAVGTASPAMAASPRGDVFIFCEASGSYCQRDVNNLSTAGNPIGEGSRIFGPASESSWSYSETSFTWLGIVYEVGTIEYDQHPGWCDGLDSSDTHVELEQCNGNGTAWAINVVNGADTFISRLATQRYGKLMLLSGQDNDGLLSTACSGCKGYYQRWDHVHN